MLKSDLIDILVQKRGITLVQASSTVETIFKSMLDAMSRGENIEIRGLGAFHVKHYDGYQGRNPKTSQVIQVRPKRGVLFRTGVELRARINYSVQAAAAEPAAVAPAPAVTGDPEKEPNSSAPTA
jgi:integration host factor subunit beta